MKADIVFVLDGSGSVDSVDFQSMLTAIKDLIDTFMIGRSNTRVGVIQFSSENTFDWVTGTLRVHPSAWHEIRFDDYMDATTNELSETTLKSVSTVLCLI